MNEKRRREKKDQCYKNWLRTNGEIDFHISIRIFAESFQLEICKKFYMTWKNSNIKI